MQEAEGVARAPQALSSQQERLFLLDRMMPGLGAYNVPSLVEIPATLDAELLAAALARVLERHDILRTSLQLHDGVPVAEVAPEGQVPLTVLDLRDAPAEDRREQARSALTQLVAQPFSLQGDVLLRAGLVHLEPDLDWLLVVFHHAASDHASSGLLFAELDELYSALRDGTTPQLPELPIQYADFAARERAALAGPETAELVDFWTSRLAGAPARLELPADHPRPPVQSYRGTLTEFTIAAPDAQALRALAREQRVSLFMVLLAAFQTLVHRYTQTDDLVLGVPVSGRHHDDVANLLGYFSNTLVLRTALDGDPSFGELLARVRGDLLEAQAYGALPFERVVEAVNPERTQSHSPIFQVLFGFDVAPAQPPALGGHPLRSLPAPGWEWSRFDLSIIVREAEAGTLKGVLEYATDLFEPDTVQRLIGHYRTLLGAVTHDPGQRLSELPLLTEAERDTMLVAWNATETALADERCLHEQIAAHAAQTPDAVAVVSASGRLTYSELDTAANRLAHVLAARGAAPGTLVGICLDRSAALVVAMLAVLKTGAAYVPIEPTYPPERQEFMLTDAQAPVLVTEERYVGTVNLGDAAVVAVDRDRDRELIAAQSAQAPSVVSDLSQRAYVIYTSGSTGKPKGVEITHRSVVNLVDHMRREPGLTASDVVANLTTPAFDLSVPDWYLTLTTGARLVVIPREATLDGVELADWLARAGATFVQATPTSWQMLVDAGWKGSESLTIVCGGEALAPALARELLTRCAALWHVYGPTETTVWSSTLRLDSGDAPLPLGGPIANTTFYVLDAQQRPVPLGVPGELYIGGHGLALGYLRRPELTAEKFVTGPFAHPLGSRLYRTGDLVRRRAEGTLEFLGRIDGQVKLRGFRIELGEIESVLREHQEVGAAVAIVREDAPGDQRLVAYLVAAEHRTLEVDELRRALKAKLPPFMVPSHFVVLDALPVTANGKLDRRGLPAPDASRQASARPFAEPEGPVQQALVAIWSEILGVPRLGVDDDFFDLGGHSMLAVRMLARVRDELGVDLFLGVIFEAPTVRALAGAVSTELMSSEDDEIARLLAEVEATS